MRTMNEKTPRKKSTFKASKGTKNKKHHSYDDESDEERENFVRKLKKGFGKYKYKLFFKCFNYGKVEHYAKKCP